KTAIDLSPFAMGNSIPSVIANEFTEATYDLYLSALVELGLVLLLVSIAVNSVARLLIWRMGRPHSESNAGVWGLLLFWKPKAATAVAESAASAAPASGRRPKQLPLPSTRPQAPPYRTSSWMNHFMTGVLGLCLAITVGFLLFIFGYLLYRGVGALNWAFFTNLPAPVGESGGGMANALYGSFLLVGLASLFAVPVGILSAIYLAEYRSDWLGPIVRFVGELLAGVPSIVIGIFGYYLVVKPMGHFSGWAGAFALGVMMIPIVMRATEE